MKKINETLGRKLQKISSTKIILFGYCLIILVGTLLLSLPIATSGDGVTGVTDAFFTATSATCVTGLVRFDTYTHWTLFGQIVILCLIQIGGIGFMTVAIALVMIARRKIGINSRMIMQDSIAAPQVGGIVRMTKLVLVGTAIVEGTGALLLCFHFCPRFGIGKGIYFSIFHSISAFCNAGFDLMGIEEQFSSLTAEAGNWYINLIIMALIVIGGLGFFVWHDLIQSRFRFSKMRLHTKIVLVITILLIVVGTLVIFLLEQEAKVFSGLSIKDQILVSAFQSVSARTAGFNSINLADMTESAQFVMICLMFIGGSTGSTAGGIKTTTFGVLVISIGSVFRQKKALEIFGRRMEEGITRTASCIFMMYLGLSLTVAVIICRIESISFMSALFESVSAIATVGLSFGITPEVSMISKLLLAMLMLVGRVGSITILLAFTNKRTPTASRLPLEKVQIG